MDSVEVVTVAQLISKELHIIEISRVKIRIFSKGGTDLIGSSFLCLVNHFGMGF
ncbi:MAG: hypothetical protein ACJAUH_002749 [Saprospiraceae bacterium]|jgi:hypothetical protein